MSIREFRISGEARRFKNYHAGKERPHDRFKEATRQRGWISRKSMVDHDGRRVVRLMTFGYGRPYRWSNG